MDTDYKAFGSFAPVYTQAIDKLYESLYPDRARQTEKILRAICEHADQLGCCYPGIYRLVQRTHYAETTVKRALLALDELDYVRVHIETVRSRKRDIVTFQVSPWVLWIAPPQIRDAISLWNEANSRLNVIVHRQPESEPESEPAAEPESEPDSNHHHHRGRGGPGAPDGTRQNGRHRPQNGTKPQAAESARSAAAAPEQGAAAQQNQRAAQAEQRPQAQEPLNSVSAAPTPAARVNLPPIESCRAPLVNPDDESLAVRIASDLMTRESQARQIVAGYGAPLVERALAHLQQATERGERIESPFGLVKWWLSNRVLSTDESARPDSLAGRYAEFFTR